MGDFSEILRQLGKCSPVQFSMLKAAKNRTHGGDSGIIRFFNREMSHYRKSTMMSTPVTRCFDLWSMQGAVAQVWCKCFYNRGQTSYRNYTRIYPYVIVKVAAKLIMRITYTIGRMAAGS